MNYLICYDICDPKRLRRIAKELEMMGIRVQYSFFELSIPDEMLNELVSRLKRIMNFNEDKLYVYPICRECKKKVILDGDASILSLKTYIIL